MKADAIYSEQLVDIIDELNRLKIPKDNVINVFQNKIGLYVAIIYH